MSKTISNNQPTSSVTVTATVPVQNWTADYRVAADKAGDVELVCIKTPLDATSQAIFKSSTVPNIYKGIGASIPTGLRDAMVTGVKLLNQRNEIWTKSDSTDTVYRVNKPVSCHIVLQVPNDELITVDEVQGLINRTCGQLYEIVDSKGTTRLAAMLRQALTPTGM